MPVNDKFHWARRVSRRDIQRLYESDAQGILDEDLLNEVHYAIYVRVRDMFEVREAQQFGRVKCRQCSEMIETLAYGPGNTEGLTPVEDWRATYYDPVRQFKQRHSHSRVQEIAAQLGIEGRSTMPEDELIPEILRLAPELEKSDNR